MRKSLLIGLVAAITFGLGAATGSASLTFYAPYDTSLDLAVGSPATPTVHGTVPLVPGYNSYGMGGNAANFDALSEALRYGNVTDYLSGVGNSQVVGANTFRLLMKPGLSNQGGRRMLLTGGNIHANDRIQLQLHDGGDVALVLVASGGGYIAAIPNGTFSTGGWNTDMWLYVAGSIVSNQVNLYVRPLTNGSTAVTATSSMTPVSWGASASSSWTQGILVGNRYDLTEAFQGSIDDVQIHAGEFWGINDFHYDFAVVIPEPSTMVMAIAAVGMLWLRRCRK